MFFVILPQTLNLLILGCGFADGGDLRRTKVFDAEIFDGIVWGEYKAHKKAGFSPIQGVYRGGFCTQIEGILRRTKIFDAEFFDGIV